MQRRVDDLYVLGRPFEMNDAKLDPETQQLLPPVEVWLQKMDPLDADKSLRKANAAKARMLMLRTDEESEEWLDIYSDVAEFDDDVLIEYLIAEDLGKYREATEAEVAGEEDSEWAKDGYLQGLRDAWEGTREEPGLKDADEDDPERQKCYAELKRFDDLVNPIVEGEHDRLVSDLKAKSKEELVRKGVRQFLEVRAGSAWMLEFRTCEIAFGVRDKDDHSRYYFSVPGKDEVDFNRVRRLPPEVFAQLTQAYGELVVPPAEGKDSPAAPSSSPSSGLSGAEETEQPSGPLVAVR